VTCRETAGGKLVGKAKFSPTSLPNLLRLTVVARHRTFAPPLTAAPISVSLLTSSFSRRDAIGESGGCELKGGQARVDCRERGIVP
jgi:hypothetical protein